MITKGQIEALRRQQPDFVQEMHYTIGGPVEAAVHSSVQAEWYGKLIQSDRTMNAAVQQFRDNMLFKSREGLARGHFAQAHGITHDKERTR